MRSNDSGGAAPIEDLAAAISSGAVRLAAATASWLRLVAEFDERGGWHGVGIRSCGHWLAWQCGLGPGAAREHVRVARALRGLPRIEAAFAAGRISYSKVRALTRIADPDCETALLEFATSASASQTERFCREWRRVDDAAGPGGDSRRVEESQSFRSWTDDEGFLVLQVRMPVETGAPLLAAIDSLAERDARRERALRAKAVAGHAAIRAAGGSVDEDVADRCADDVAAGFARERTAARRITALAALAEAGVELDRRPGDPPRREVVIHVDAAVLADDTAAGRAYYEGGPPVTGTQARRILCEATAVAMIESGREPLVVGRRRRRATKAQRRALLRRDGGCARPSCPETRPERLHAHHLRHWLAGGRTDIDNLVLLCDADHGLVHDLGLVLTRRDGGLVVTAPDGTRVWGGADAAFAGGLHGAPTTPAGGADPYAGVAPFDTTVGRRPAEAPAPDRERRRPAPPTRPAPPARRCSPLPGPAGPGRSRSRRAGAPRTTVGVARESVRLGRVLFPDGPPDLAPPAPLPFDRLDMAFAIGVLMGNRDAARRRTMVAEE
ncbi:HNH endonuclease signature motif containing protein [Blastococcus xanthinilyticus]|uniref:HNH endonuclease n=1 Tax=Blastococcus xanthinilyticus TaxID=1564164 RepID=A0A5S5CX03_9ACTN|nr:HNH endonuclease signature motif containing protein [Blastococcus xanthinilyticus]TYP88105.1 HNH endonuclease [Blastococcus xanthinilyticus]